MSSRGCHAFNKLGITSLTVFIFLDNFHNVPCCEIYVIYFSTCVICDCHVLLQQEWLRYVLKV